MNVEVMLETENKSPNLSCRIAPNRMTSGAGNIRNAMEKLVSSDIQIGMRSAKRAVREH